MKKSLQLRKARIAMPLRNDKKLLLSVGVAREGVGRGNTHPSKTKQFYCNQTITLQKKITHLLESYKPFSNLKKSFSGKRHCNTKLSTV